MVSVNFYEGGGGKILVVGIGQSLMENLQKVPNDDFNNQGGRSLVNVLSNGNYRGGGDFVDSGDGSSCYLKSTCISTNQDDQDDYWITDCGNYAAGTAPWNGSTGVQSYFRGETATAPTAGVRYNDMVADIAAAGYAMTDIDYFILSMGESEASTLSAGNLSEAQLVNVLQWLHDKTRADAPNMKKFGVITIGRRSIGANPVGYERVRNAQRTFAANNPTTVLLMPAMYDLLLRNDSLAATYLMAAGQTVINLPFNVGSQTFNVYKNGVLLSSGYTLDSTADTITFSSGATANDFIELYTNDSVHRSPKATITEGARIARAILKDAGLYTGNTVGAKITSATLDGSGNIVATVTHDAGDSLANSTNIDYSVNEKPISVTPSATTGKGVLSLLDSSGGEVTLQKVEITDANKITLYPTSDFKLLSDNNKLYTGYGDMLNLDTRSIIYDNGAGNPLPLHTGYVSVNGAGLAGIETLSNLVSFFSPENTYNVAGAGSDAAVWNKRAGSAGNARRDDLKAAPVWYSDSNMGLSLAGWYFDGASGKKLLVDTALTTSSNVTVFVVATPDTSATDTTAPSPTTNVMVSTGAASSSDNNLFSLYQLSSNLASRGGFIAEQGTTAFASLAGRKTGISAIRRNGVTADYWDETGHIITKTIANTPAIDLDGSTPVFAIGNAVDKPTGAESGQCFYGAIHYVLVFDAALTDAMVNQIRLALGAAAGVTVS